jgi:hypothetical protein
LFESVQFPPRVTLPAKALWKWVKAQETMKTILSMRTNMDKKSTSDRMQMRQPAAVSGWQQYTRQISLRHNFKCSKSAKEPNNCQGDGQTHQDDTQVMFPLATEEHLCGVTGDIQHDNHLMANAVRCMQVALLLHDTVDVCGWWCFRHLDLLSTQPPVRSLCK